MSKLSLRHSLQAELATGAPGQDVKDYKATSNISRVGRGKVMKEAKERLQNTQRELLIPSNEKEKKKMGPESILQ